MDGNGPETRGDVLVNMHMGSLASRVDAHRGLAAEVVRRLMSKPRYAAGDPDKLRSIVEAEIARGIVTIHGLVRAVERGT